MVKGCWYQVDSSLLRRDPEACKDCEEVRGLGDLEEGHVTCVCSVLLLLGIAYRNDILCRLLP